MATYVVGDIQGCFKPLKRLLKQAGFDWKSDHLWAVGDLVNRGPDSLQVLRWCYRHRDRITCVLGNHDLHLLAVANGLQNRNRNDNLDKVLVARDRDRLLDWLRHCPLIHSERGYTMVHAGIPHLWSVQQAHDYAAEVEAALRGPAYRKFLARMYGNSPRRWKADLSGYDRLRLITNYLTRMRFVDRNGALDLRSKGRIPEPGRKVVPWYSLRQERAGGNRLIFGHWAALQGEVCDEHLLATDTGCVWGGKLSLYCLDTGAWYRCAC